MENRCIVDCIWMAIDLEFHNFQIVKRFGDAHQMIMIIDDDVAMDQRLRKKLEDTRWQKSHRNSIHAESNNKIRSVHSII